MLCKCLKQQTQILTSIRYFLIKILINIKFLPECRVIRVHLCVIYRPEPVEQQVSLIPGSLKKMLTI